MMDGLQMLGADAPTAAAGGNALAASPYAGLFGGIAKLLSGTAEAALDSHDKDEAEKSAGILDQLKLTAVLAADTTATLALANALTSTALAQGAATGKARSEATTKAQKDQTAADAALAAQDTAGQGISASVVDKRVTAAQGQLQTARAKAAAEPSNVYAASLAKAWEMTLNKATYGQIVKKDKAKNEKLTESSSFLTKRVGPLPVWGYGVAGVGVIGLGLILKRVLG